jgi:hypothetical protein
MKAAVFLHSPPCLPCLWKYMCVFVCMCLGLPCTSRQLSFTAQGVTSPRAYFISSIVDVFIMATLSGRKMSHSNTISIFNNFSTDGSKNVLMYWSNFPSLWQIPKKNNLKGGITYFGSQFQRFHSPQFLPPLMLGPWWVSISWWPWDHVVEETNRKQKKRKWTRGQHTPSDRLLPARPHLLPPKIVAPAGDQACNTRVCGRHFIFIP